MYDKKIKFKTTENVEKYIIFKTISRYLKVTTIDGNVIEMTPWQGCFRPATLLKRGSITGVFL